MLLFKDVKQNYPVWILDKQELILIQGKVTQVSFPHIDSSRPTLGCNQNMVVDVTISAEGKTATYTIPENLCITDAGHSLVLATEKENLIHEVEALRNNAQQILSSVPRQKEIIEKSEELLVKLNPLEAQYEERFKSIESGMTDIKSMLLKFIEENEKTDSNSKKRNT